MNPTFVDMNTDLELIHRLVYLAHGQLLVLDKGGRPVKSFTDLYASGVGVKLSMYYWQEVISSAKSFCIGAVSGNNQFMQDLTREEFKTITNSRFIYADGPYSC